MDRRDPESLQILDVQGRAKSEDRCKKERCICISAIVFTSQVEENTSEFVPIDNCES